jgi:hypothetical protein
VASSAAIIGSFRQRYEDVLIAWGTFRDAGWTITSPLGSPVIAEGIPFVRFETDPAAWDDPMVQTVALHRILRAELVYVVAPGGYVGRTTCYEVGRIVQARQPIYFSEQPEDLPLAIPDSWILSAEDVVRRFSAEDPRPLYDSHNSEYADLERRLVDREYLDV